MLYLIKNAFRNFTRHPRLVIISLSGIILGITCTLLIMLLIQFVTNHDDFHEKLDDIYEINAEVHWGSEPWIQNNLQAALVPEMQERFPEIEYISRYAILNDIVLNINDEPFYEDLIALVDSQFFKIFTFPVISGSEEDFFQNPYSIMLSEEMAEKYFGSKDPTGMSLKLNNYTMRIAGIIKDVPENSTLKFNFIIPFQFMGIFRDEPEIDNDWDNWYLRSFLVLHENTDISSFKVKIIWLYHEHENIESDNKVLIHPFKDMYLNPPRITDTGLDMMDYLRIIGVIAFMILVIACINFMNLTTADFTTRSKEVGIKKTMGFRRSNLMKQFFTESIILACIGGIISLLLIPVLLPLFNQTFEVPVTFDINSFGFLGGFILVVLLTGLLAGSYPAIYLSSFQPVRALKGNLSSGSGKSTFRKGLVVFQFSLSILFIVGTLTIKKQVNFMLNADIGLNKENVIIADLNDGSKYELLKEELLKNANVQNVSGASYWDFGLNSNTAGYDFPGKSPDFDQLLTYQLVDYDYLETLEVPIVDGRSFSKDYGTDEDQAYILNETAIKEFGIQDPVGSRFNLWGTWGTIIGIMKDAHFRNLNSEIDPRIIRITSGNISRVLIRLKGIGKDNLSFDEIMKSIKGTWSSVYPDIPFEFTFLNDDYKGTYLTDQMISKLLKVFAFLGIFISCLGLFGLTVFTAKRRTKEIGIRKTNGATVANIMTMLNRDIVKWVVISLVIATPIAWYAMNKWLQNFAYKTNLSWWVFILAGLMALGIALLTVSWQSYRAASRNPVEALRYE